MHYVVLLSLQHTNNRLLYKDLINNSQFIRLSYRYMNAPKGSWVKFFDVFTIRANVRECKLTFL
jgi:hypothetical protein